MRALVLALLLALAGPARARDVFTNPYFSPGAGAEYNVKLYGAVCDGAADDSSEVQAAIDAATTNGGTVIIPSACVIGVAGETSLDYVQMKSNITMQCQAGPNGGRAGFKALSGIASGSNTGILRNDGTGASSTNDYTIRDCAFNENSIRVGGIYIEESENGRAINNRIYGSVTGSGNAFDHLRLDCEDKGAAGNNVCEIRGNWIVGSSASAANDTCINTQAGFAIFPEQTLIVVDNHLYGCGIAGINLQSGTGASPTRHGGATIIGNHIKNAKTDGITCTISGCDFTAIEGNVMHVARHNITFGGNDGTIQSNLLFSDVGAGAWSILLTPQNLGVAGAGKTCGTGANNCFTGDGNNLLGAGCACDVNGDCQNSNCGSGGGASQAFISGNRIANNYANGGIAFDSKGLCVGGTDASCSASPYGSGCSCDVNADCQSSKCGTFSTGDHNAISGAVIATAQHSGVLIENLTDTALQDIETIQGSSGSTKIAGIEVVQLDDTADGPLVVGDANLVQGGSGTAKYGLWFRIQQGTGALNDVLIDHVLTSESGAGTSTSLQIDSTPTCSGWQVTGLDTRNMDTAVSGWSTTCIPGARQYMTINASTDCGDGTVYFSPGVTTCNATETTGDWPAIQPMTITGLWCQQLSDSTCTPSFTVRKSAADTDFTCTTGGAITTGSCNDVAFSTAASFNAGGLFAIKVVDTVPNCDDNGIAVTCTVEFVTP